MDLFTCPGPVLRELVCVSTEQCSGMSARSDLTALEVAVGSPLGRDRSSRSLSDTGVMADPADRFEAACLTALQRPPCVVSFSGGRDSSAVLAVAVAVARREGLPPPIPVTLRFPEMPESDEADWQRSVLQHLGVRERIELSFNDELDVLGPISRRLIARHGVRWPGNLHLHQPICEVATGGSLLTGFGGDELALCGITRWAARIIEDRAIRSPRQLLTLANAGSPFVLRYLAALPSATPDIEITPWLTSRARLRYRNQLACGSASEPLGWKKLLLKDFHRSRYVNMARESIQMLCDLHSVMPIHPFVEPDVLVSLAVSQPLSGYFGKKKLLECLIGDRLPAEILSRKSKAEFTRALWSAQSLEFAEQWTGSGVDERLIRVDALQREWCEMRQRPSIASILLLQQVWLDQEGTTSSGAS